jgi:hypothetical protein
MRPTVIGVITPGNSTVFRIGMMISASSGSGLRAGCFGVAALTAGGSLPFSDRTFWFMRLPCDEK